MYWPGEGGAVSEVQVVTRDAAGGEVAHLVLGAIHRGMLSRITQALARETGVPATRVRQHASGKGFAGEPVAW